MKIEETSSQPKLHPLELMHLAEEPSSLGQVILPENLVASPEKLPPQPLPTIFPILNKSPVIHKVEATVLTSNDDQQSSPGYIKKMFASNIQIEEIAADNTPLTLIQQNLDHHRDQAGIYDLKLLDNPNQIKEDAEGKLPDEILKEPPNEISSDKVSGSKRTRKRTKVRGDAFTVEFASDQSSQEAKQFEGGIFLKYSREEKEKFEKMMRLKDISWGQVEELYTCFCEFDIFGNGNIDPFSIKHVSNFTGRKISEEDAKEIIGIMDETGDGVLEFCDFISVMSGVTKEPLDEWDLKQVFKVFDNNDDSFISPGEMHRAFLTLGIDLTQHELQDIFEEFDEDEDGLISYDEFEYLIEGAHDTITKEEREKMERFELEQFERNEEVRLIQEAEEVALATRMETIKAERTSNLKSLIDGQ